MFNLEELKKIKMLQVDFDELLLAGSRYLGKGWTPERARNRLMQLSGYFLMKPKFASYLQTWLLTIALVTGASLPLLHISQEVTEAAFALTAAYETRAPTVGEKAVQQPGDLRFPWDEEKKKLPRELQELWRRAEKGEKPIDMTGVLSKLPTWQGATRWTGN